jgi:hypothetical protein
MMKKNIIRKEFFVVFFFFLLTLPLFCQEGTATPRLRVVRGARLDFIFNSLVKYNNGVTYTDFTQLNIYYNDTVGAGVPTPGAGWELTVRALQPEIVGDITSTVIELGSIVLNVKIDGVEPGNEYSLTTAPLVIASGNDPDIVDVNKVILISYMCGTIESSVNMMGLPPDYYFVDIEFNLKKKE